jgi:RNA polymerase sigma factor (sigma-70 family)
MDADGDSASRLPAPGDAGWWPRRDALALSHSRLALSAARRWHPRCPPTLELDDLRQEALLALLRAAGHFDPARGHEFSTYAHEAIERALHRAVVRWKYGLPPTVDLTDELPLEELRAAAAEGISVACLVERVALHAALGRLPTEQIAVVWRHYGFDGRGPQSLELTGAALGFSRERARRLRNQALQTLRDQLATAGFAAA